MSNLFTKVTTTILHGLSMGSSLLGKRRISTGPEHLLNFYIAYSPAHARWTEGIRHQLKDALATGMPQVQSEIYNVELRGSRNEVLTTLFKHPTISGSVKEPGYSFIITPGWWESELVREARAKSILGLPQLFCLPTSPSKLFKEEAKSDPQRRGLGGVYAWPSEPDQYLDILGATRKGVRKILILHNQIDGSPHMAEMLRYQIAMFKNACAPLGIQVATQQWTFKDMARYFILNHLQTCDAVVTLHEPTADIHGPDLSELCRKVGKTWVASNLDAAYGPHGAALGVGVHGSVFGRPLVSLIAQFLASPSRGLGWGTYCLPPQSGAHVNEPALAEQGIELDRQQKALLYAKRMGIFPETEY